MAPRVEADSENTILRVNYETGRIFNTLPEVIDAGGQLPPGWKNEDGQIVLRKKRRLKNKATWNAERFEWKPGEEERAIEMNAAGMKWSAIAKLYGISRATICRRIKSYQKLNKQLSGTGK